jgi:hypothetical protein
MKTIVIAVVALVGIADTSTAAAPGSLASAGIACSARTDWRNGRTAGVKVCLDGTYKTCVRDARDRLGWGAAGVKRCDDLRRQGLANHLYSVVTRCDSSKLDPRIWIAENSPG